MKISITLLDPFIGALIGAFNGWILGWFFTPTILHFFAGFSLTGLDPWEIGLMLGFIGTFFKPFQGLSFESSRS